jgi:hypothetical protein
LATSTLIDTDPHDVGEVRSRLRDALDELADAGDLLELAGGRWLGASCREVGLGTNTDDRLVVGGLPTTILPINLRALLSHNGAFRATRGAALGTALGLRSEPLTSWLGGVEEELVPWGRSLVSIELEPYAAPPDGVRFRVYAPAQSKARAPQGFRWRDQLKELTGVFFAYRELAFGMSEPRIIELKHGRVMATALPSLAAGDARRLMYALDAIAANPTSVHVRSGKHLEVVLRSEVPRSEQRLFAALGQLTEMDKYYPRTWTFRAEHAQNVLPRLALLRVSIDSELA